MSLTSLASQEGRSRKSDGPTLRVPSTRTKARIPSISRVSIRKDSDPDVEADSPWSGGRGRHIGGHLHHAATAPVDQRYDALFAENEALVERIQELEEENERLLAAAKEHSDVDQEEDDDGMDMRAVPTSGQTKRCVEHLEWQLLQEEQRRDDAQRVAKAEEDAKEQLLQQLSDCQDKQKETESEFARLQSCLADAELKAKTALAELQAANVSREEVQQTLEAERQLLSEEREKCRQLEEEIEDMRASKAYAQVAYGRRITGKKRFVTNNLMSQLDSLSEGDEEEEEQLVEEEVPNSPTAPELSGSNNELLEDLGQQLSSALRAKEEAVADAKAARTLFQTFQREHEQVSREADIRDAAHAALVQRSAKLERALELERKDNKELRAIANTPWWSRLTCCSRPTAPAVRAPESPPMVPVESASTRVKVQFSLPAE